MSLMLAVRSGCLSSRYVIRYFAARASVCFGKNAIAFELERFFHREVGDSCSRLSQTYRRNHWENGLKNFRADGLQTVSFSIIKISGLRDLTRLSQEKYQFDGACDLMGLARDDFPPYAYRAHNFPSACHPRKPRAYGKPDSLALRVRDTARPSALTWRGIEASFSPRLAWITEKINTLRTTYL